MPLRKDVQDAFTTLGLTPQATLPEATKVYKRLALVHHPDRNHGDSSATQRFQQIGAAWDIIQRHYENPSWSSRPDYPRYSSADEDDGDIELDDDELFDFYMFMFAETLFNRYSRASGQRYRYEHSRHRPSSFFSFSDLPRHSQGQLHTGNHNERRQMKEKEEYERRKKELEQEILDEERELERRAKAQKADQDRLATAQDQAFQAAHAGRGDDVRKLVLQFDLDVTAPRNLKHGKIVKKADDRIQFESLLHAAAGHCDESLFLFLLERGAQADTLNKQQLSPFHSAIKAGNSKLVRFVLESRSKVFENYHPSKATLSGHTPLQLAIESGDLDTIELLVKHATTHDVERCWKQEGISDAIREVLRTKKGFSPSDDSSRSSPASVVSKKVLRERELVLHKQARIADEQRRAEINRQKKAERAARRVAMERQQAGVDRAQREDLDHLEGRRTADEIRTLQENEHQASTLQPKVEETIEVTEQNLRGHNCSTASSPDSGTEPTEPEREHIPEHRREEEGRITRDVVDIDEQQQYGEEPPSPLVSPETPAPDLTSLPRTHKKLTVEERQELRRVKQRERRHAKKAERLAEPSTAKSSKQPTSTGPVPKPSQTTGVNKDEEHQRRKHEATMKRRAEQSARDKERHRKMLEERQKATADVLVKPENEYVPLTPVSTHSSRPSSTIHRNIAPVPSVMEDIQTCIIPDDLFPKAQPIDDTNISTLQLSSPPTFASNSSNHVPESVQASSSAPNSRPHRRFFRYPNRGRRVVQQTANSS